MHKLSRVGMQIVTLTKRPKMKEFPGGEFLIAHAHKPQGEWPITPRHWDASDPGSILLTRVGQVETTGKHVFEFEGELYVRAYRHIVRGMPFASCKSYYKEHAHVWGINGRWQHDRVALVPFDSEYTPCPKT